MRKINYLFLFLIAAVFIYSCSGKTGATGPMGAKGAAGPAGETGATGAVGATGANGTKIYSGIDTPTVAVGDTGDFYLDLTTSGFYGPKTTTGWGVPFSLIGATGATGATGQTGATGTPGSVIYSGATVPDSTIGINGDYYLNTVTELFYGPKTDNQWPAPISIMGQPGTANVIYSDWETTSVYSVSKIFGRTTFKASFAEPKITQSILDQGAIIVYGKLDGYNPEIWPVNQVSQLPIVLSYVQPNPNTGKNQGEIDTWSGVDTLGSVGITFTNNHNLYTKPDSIYNNMQFRYIIIPGGVSATGNSLVKIKGKMTNRVINPINVQALQGKSYDEVKQMLHLKD
jgi:hypothetical protein